MVDLFYFPASNRGKFPGAVSLYTNLCVQVTELWNKLPVPMIDRTISISKEIKQSPGSEIPPPPPNGGKYFGNSKENISSVEFFYS